MNIQQNLNALLTMGAVAARTSDKYQTNAEIKRTSKESKAINEIINKESSDLAANKDLLKTDPTSLKEDVQTHLGHLQQRIDIDERMAHLDPSVANLNEASESRAFLRGQQETYGSALTGEVAAQETDEERIRKMAMERRAVSDYRDQIDTVYSQKSQFQIRQEALRQKGAPEELSIEEILKRGGKR